MRLIASKPAQPGQQGVCGLQVLASLRRADIIKKIGLDAVHVNVHDAGRAQAAAGRRQQQGAGSSTEGCHAIHSRHFCLTASFAQICGCLAQQLPSPAEDVPHSSSHWAMLTDVVFAALLAVLYCQGHLEKTLKEETVNGV